MTRKKTIFNKLGKLVAMPGFIFSLAAILRRDLYYSLEEAIDIDWRKRLSFQEFSYLIGLMVKNEIDITKIPEKKDFEKFIIETYQLFNDLKIAYMSPFFDQMKKISPKKGSLEDAEKSFKEVFGSAEMMKEPIFYDDSGAYDFQYWELTSRRYLKDRKWIRKNRGVDISILPDMAKRLKKISEAKNLKISFKGKSFNEICELLLQLFCFSKKELNSFNTKQVEALLTNFSIKPGSVNKKFVSPEQYNEFESHPIIILKEDFYFLPICFNLTKSIYESPFYWMAKDRKYKDSSFLHRGDVTEEIAADLLSKVFGSKNVYKGLRICKKRGQFVSDIDVLAITGNKAVIVQAKSKRLTELARKGNEKKIREDFNNAVQEAYNQGLICREAILNKDNILITSSDEKIKLDESIDDAYIICLTSDHYPAVSHQLKTYLKKKKADPYPIAISLFDLDILTFYLNDPFEFLYYLKQRILLSDYFIGGGELSYLAYHLNQKLFPAPEADKIGIDPSWGQLIDANFLAARGYYQKTKAAEKLHTKWANPKFQQIVDQIKSTKNPGLTDALFFLYDLAGKGADELIEWIERTKEKSIKSGKSHDFTMIYEDGNSGISYICQIGKPETLMSHLFLLANARKYKTKANLWLGLGSIVSSKNLIDAIVFSKEPWKPNSKLKELSKSILKQGKVIKSRDIK